jgi:uncharacterized SAM-binding protein YcdF (DUF218 family)
MNDWLIAWCIPHIKPFLTAWLLPPLPFLGLAVMGLWLLRRGRRGVATAALACAWLGIWASSSWTVTHAFMEAVLSPPPPLALQDLKQQFKRSPTDARKTAVWVLGGGREDIAPEYGRASLRPLALMRLRYGIWLGRELGVGVGFSGGVGHAGAEGDSEAAIAQTIATQEFQLPLTWLESSSRDTLENARLSLPVLKAAGMERVIVVTQDWHMPRSMANFERARGELGWTDAEMTLIPAPMGQASGLDQLWQRLLPSSEGFMLGRAVWRETLGRWMGA